jgi:hypothetical protein
MTAAIELASDVVAGGTALGGLFLVYIGGLTASFGGYSREQQPHVRSKFQTKAWLAVVGLIGALIAAGVAIAGKWFENNCAVSAAIVLFVLTIVLACVVAVLSAREIH